MTTALFRTLFDYDLQKNYLDLEIINFFISQQNSLMYTPVGIDGQLPLVYTYGTIDEEIWEYERVLLPIARLFKEHGYNFNAKGSDGRSFIEYIEYIRDLCAKDGMTNNVEQQNKLIDDLKKIISA